MLGITNAAMKGILFSSYAVNVSIFTHQGIFHLFIRLNVTFIIIADSINRILGALKSEIPFIR